MSHLVDDFGCRIYPNLGITRHPSPHYIARKMPVEQFKIYMDTYVSVFESEMLLLFGPGFELFEQDEPFQENRKVTFDESVFNDCPGQLVLFRLGLRYVSNRATKRALKAARGISA